MAAPLRSAFRAARRLQHASFRSFAPLARDNLPVRISKLAELCGEHGRCTSVIAAQDTPNEQQIDLSKVPGTTLGAERMVIMYTCRVCETRSARIITKQAYTYGVVLVRCPGCRGLHLIADRLGHFHDASVDVEALLKAKGEAVTRGNVGGDVRLAPTGAAGNDLSAPKAQTSDSAAVSEAAAIDPNVFEFSADDLRVLKSETKSVNLKSGIDVHDAKSSST